MGGVVLLIAISLATSIPPFGLMALSIVLVAGWWFWPATKAFLWSEYLPAADIPPRP